MTIAPSTTLRSDFSIRFGDGNFGDNRCDLLFEEQCRIIAAPSFINTYPAFDPDNLADTIEPGLLLDHGDPNGIGWMNWELWHELTDASFPGSSRLTKVESYPTMLDMVCAAEGISIGTIGIEDDLISAGKLVCVGRPIARESFGYYLVYRRDLLSSPSFNGLRTWLLGGREHR